MALRKSFHWPSWGIKIVITLGLLGFLWGAERQALGDFLRLEPTTDIDAYKLGRMDLPPERLEADEARLELTRRVDPDNPVVPEYLAQIALIRARRAFPDTPRQRHFLEVALTHYQRALELRPNSGYVWAGKMTTLYDLLQADNLLPEPRPAAEVQALHQAILEALRRAFPLAPWEMSVLQQVVRVGQGLDHTLTPSDRALVHQAEAHLALRSH